MYEPTLGTRQPFRPSGENSILSPALSMIVAVTGFVIIRELFAKAHPFLCLRNAQNVHTMIPFRLSNRPLIGHTSVNRFGLVIKTLPRGFSAKLLPPSRRIGGRNFIPLVLMWHGRSSIRCGIMSSPASGTSAGHGLYQNHA